MYKILGNKKLQKKIWIILCIIILPAFLLWGAGSLLRSPKEKAARYRLFGQMVSEQDLADSLQAVRTQAYMQFGDKFLELEKFLNFEAQALERLVLYKEAKKRKIKVSDREVVDFISENPFFQNKGQFDARTYNYMLTYVFRTQARIFEEQTRQNIMIEKLFDSVTKNTTVSDAEVKETYTKENEQISVYYIASLTADFTKEIQVSPDEVKAYFTEHSISFKQPLSFNIEYILLESEEKKQAFVTGLSKKEDFAKLAGQLSLAIKETGLFNQDGPIPGIGWSPDIILKVSNQKVGYITEPIQIDKNYYVVRLKERKDPYIPEFEKIKDKAQERLVQEKAQDLAKTKIEQCLAMLKDMTKNNPKAVDFDKAAKAFGLKTSSTDLFTYSSYIQNIGASDEFFEVARNLKNDAFSDIISTPAGFYIIRLKLKMAIDEAKFKAEKDNFSKKLLEAKKQESFGKFYEELKKKALQ